jgi:hypothetical protein
MRSNRLGEEKLLSHEYILGQLVHELVGNKSRKEFYIGTPISRTPEMSFLRDTDSIYRSPNLPKRRGTGVHEKLYKEASTREARREEKKLQFNKEKIDMERTRLDRIRKELRISASRCRDTRSCDLRSSDHIKKKDLLIIKGLEEKRKRDEAELKECTFSPKLICRPRPFKFNASVCLNPSHLTRPPISFTTVALSGLESTSTIEALV